MKIKMIQSGGIAGLTKEAQVDTDADDLSTDELNTLQKAIKDSNFFTLQSKDTEPMPDMEQIYITVEQEGKEHMVQMTSADIPAPLKPLVEDLKKHAKIKQF